MGRKKMYSEQTIKSLSEVLAVLEYIIRLFLVLFL